MIKIVFVLKKNVKKTYLCQTFCTGLPDLSCQSKFCMQLYLPPLLWWYFQSQKMPVHIYIEPKEHKCAIMNCLSIYMWLASHFVITKAIILSLKTIFIIKIIIKLSTLCQSALSTTALLPSARALLLEQTTLNYFHYMCRESLTYLEVCDLFSCNDKNMHARWGKTSSHKPLEAN